MHPADPALSPRYARQTALPELGPAGQRRLLAGSVLIVGVGGLGSPAALYLAAAGVGRLVLADDDCVEVSNLQRQILYATAEQGLPKAAAAATRLRALNPDIRIEVHPERIHANNAGGLVATCDVVLDATDTFAARYLLNTACHAAGKPLVSGSVHGFEGQLSVFHTAAGGPCYECLFPSAPPDGAAGACSTGGVLGALPGIVGCLQALEAIKLIAGIGSPTIGRLVLVDGLRTAFRELSFSRNPACPCCGVVRTAQTTAKVLTTMNDRMSVLDLKRELDGRRSLYLLDVREPSEVAEGRLEQSVHIPLGQIQERVNEIPREASIVCICRSGGRSARVTNYLRQLGYDDVRNLDGGLLAWAEHVDPSLCVH